MVPHRYCAIAIGSSCTWERRRFRLSCRFWKRKTSALESLDWPSFLSPNPLSRSMDNPSCSAPKVPRRPSAAVASFNPLLLVYDAATARRLPAWTGCARPIRSSRLSAALAFLALAPWTERRLVALTGLGLSEVESGLASLASSGALVELAVGPKRFVRLPAELVAELEERALRALSRLHAARPRHSSIPHAQLAAAFPDVHSEALVSGLIDRLAATGKVITDLRTVALTSFQPKLSQGERKLMAELAGSIRAGGMSPPDAAELAAAAGPRAGAVADLLGLLRDQEQLVEINGQIFLDAEVAGELHRRVLERLADGTTITMAALRDLLGTTRKFAVPIGEYLDRVGLTKRDGDVRRLGPAGAGALGSHDQTAPEQ